MGLTISLYSLYQSIKLASQMMSGQIPRYQITHYMAVMTASIMISVLLAKTVFKISQNTRKTPASVDEFIDMMNKRPGVTAQYATGDMLEHMQAQNAAGAHWMLEGEQLIFIDESKASRWTAFHEWLHRFLQLRNGGIISGEDNIIEDFLMRHKSLFGL